MGVRWVIFLDAEDSNVKFSSFGIMSKGSPTQIHAGAFGHCPFSFCPPPPALKRALWGTFFRADFVKSPF